LDARIACLAARASSPWAARRQAARTRV
jgi:hypothetical protein